MAELIYAGDGGAFKICGTCREIKSLREFARRKSAIDGLRNACRECENAPRRDGDPIGATIRCDGCSTPLVKTGPGHRFCDDCVRERANERTLSEYYKSREELGIIPLGSIIKCIDCGKDIVRTASKVTRCAACYKFKRDNRHFLEKGEAPRHRPKGKLIPCEICGDEFPRRSANSRFCGKDCYLESLRRRRAEKNKNKPPKTFECARCGDQFAADTHYKKYCEPCNDEVLKEGHRAAAKRHAYKNGSVPSGTLMTCIQCGGEFPSRQGHNYFCSEECQIDSWRPRRNEQRNERRATDVKFRLDALMSSAMKRGLKFGKAGKSWKEMVDYTVDDLKAHIEKQFLPGMLWQNHGNGKGKWNIDHIVPLASYEYKTPEDAGFMAAWALTNLRPLWALDNVRKGGRRYHLI